MKEGTRIVWRGDHSKRRGKVVRVREAHPDNPSTQIRMVDVEWDGGGTHALPLGHPRLKVVK